MNNQLAGSNLTSVRESNLSLVISLIQKAKICSRADIAQATGLRQATITNIVNDLIDWGLVKEVGYISGKMNRRSIGIALDNGKHNIIGVRLNREYAKVGLFDIGGELLRKTKIRIDTETSPIETLGSIRNGIMEICGKHENVPILGIGVAIPGPYLTTEETIILMSGFPGWGNKDIKTELGKDLGLPVFLEHDANCGALAELQYGDIGTHENIVYIAADIGVGAGVLIQGKLYHGSLGVAGEIGHTTIDYSGPKCECGNRGCLELYCSTKALLQEYKKELINSPHSLDNGEKTVEEIMRDVLEGDPFARRVFKKIASFLGVGIVNVVNSFNPGLIIISDRIAMAGDYVIEVVREVLRNNLLAPVFENLEIRLGSFVKDPMFYGASALVLQEILKSPSEYFNPDNKP